MPEGYVHAAVAQAAAKRAGWQISCLPSFLAGANGPDMLFCFQVWKKRAARTMDLPGFGGRLHDERTGAFLQALHRHAHTPAQKDYFMGFLAHYATDCAVHPYVVAMTQPGMPYGQAGGHGYFEISLDSRLHQQHTGNPAIPVKDICPRLPADSMQQVAQQFCCAVREVFGLNIPEELIDKAFLHSTTLRGLFQTHTGFRYGVFWLVEPLFGGRGFITGHVSPRALYGERKKDKAAGRTLPTQWIDPATGQQRCADVWQLIAQAEEDTVALYRQLLNAPAGELADFWAAVGSKDYVTGTQTEASARAAAGML